MLDFVFLALLIFAIASVEAAPGSSPPGGYTPAMDILRIPSYVPIASPSVFNAPPHKADEVLGGVALTSGNGTYNSITTTLKAPHINPPLSTFSAAYTWIGIDGIGCGYVALQTGFRIVAHGDEALYSAWYRWYPEAAEYLDDSEFLVKEGDDVQFTLSLSNTTAGTVTILNLSGGDSFSINLTGKELCGQGAEWMVELAPTSNGSYIPLADFGILDFKGAAAGLKAGGVADPTSTRALIYDVVRDGEQLTETAVGHLNARIRYHGGLNE